MRFNFFFFFFFIFSRDAFSNCWEEAGRKYGIDPLLLYSIAQKESSLNPLAINSRGSNDEDVGLMQINTFWFDKLREHGISRSDLFEPCVSINVGAWVLAHSIKSFGYTWEAVGAYNVGTSREKWAYKKRQEYYTDVQNIYFNNVNKWVHNNKKSDQKSGNP